MTYVPDPILAEVLGRLDEGTREAFADALMEAIGATARAKAEAIETHLSRADYGPILQLDAGYPWRLTWHERGYDGDPDSEMVEVEVTLDEVMYGANVDQLRAEREAKEAEEARRVAEARAKQEALRASGKAKIVAAGLTLEEQVALGFTGYIVK